MSEKTSGREPSGLGPAFVIVAFLIGAILVGAVAVIYRQARAAQAEAQAQRVMAEKREREIREVTELNMKMLADLEEKEKAAQADVGTPVDKGAPGDSAQKPSENDPVRIADLHTALGEAYLAQGNRQRAVQEFGEAVEVLKKAFGPEDARVLEAQNRQKKAQEPGS